jgi:hypothetical protein
MKRYTGQKALYEAISRSRAKAKRGNILERFLPEVTGQEKPPPRRAAARRADRSPAEPPVVKEPRGRAVRLREAGPQAEREAQRLETPEKTEISRKAGIAADGQAAAGNGRLAGVGPPDPMWWRLKVLNDGRPRSGRTTLALVALR